MFNRPFKFLILSYSFSKYLTDTFSSSKLFKSAICRGLEIGFKPALLRVEKNQQRE